MDSKLQISIPSPHKDAGKEPVSPTGQFLNSKAMSLCIISVLESEIPIDDSCATDLLQNVFLPINPRFSSIMVSDRKGKKHWKRVEVNLQDHIKIPSAPDGLSIQEYDNHFEKYLIGIGMHPLPQDRPLWEVHITKYPTSKAAGHLIFKLHHALGDGYSLMGALLSCLQRVDNPALPLTFPSLKSSSKAKVTKMGTISCVRRSLSAMYYTVCDFAWSMLKSSLIKDDKTPIRSGDENVELHPVKIVTVAMSLDQISMIKTKLGVTVNDVIAGTIFLGTRLYMQDNGKGFGSSKCTALVVLNTRNISGYKSVQEMLKPGKIIWGNQFAFLHVGLPKLVDDKPFNPLDFVAHAHKIIKRKRVSLAVYLTGRSLEMMRKLRGPEAAAQFIRRGFENSSMTITNMIGPVEQMALANHPCKGLYFTVTGAPQSLGITVLSYMRTVRITILIGETHIDSHKLKSSIENAFEMIYKAAHDKMSGDAGRQSVNNRRA